MIDVNDRANVKTCEVKCVDVCEPKKLKGSEDVWTYLVSIGFAIIFTLIVAPMSSVGLLYNDFLEDLGEGTSGLTIVFGVFNFVVSCTGLLTTCVLKMFTLRQVGLLGAFVFTLGSILGIFVQTLGHLVFTNGFLQGIGVGIMIPISLTSFNSCFTKRRTAMMSAVSVVIGAGAMVFPMGVEVMMEKFGFRGTLALLCAINFHAIPAMAVMYHGEGGDQENSSSLYEKKNNFKEAIVYKKVDVNFNDEDITVKYAVKNPLIRHATDLHLPIEKKESFLSIKSDVTSSLCQFMLKKKLEAEYETNLKRATSITSLGNWTSNVLATEALPTAEGKWRVLIDFLDLNLIKDPLYINICMGVTMATFSDATFFALEPTMLNSYGFSKAEIAYCITVGAATDLVSRTIVAIVSFYVKFRSRDVFFVGNFLIIIFRIAFVQFNDLYTLIILTGCIGFFRNFLNVNVPLTFTEYKGTDKFPAAYGFFMLVSGLTTLFLGPFIGFLRDYTNDYVMAFHTLTLCSLLCAIPWAIEYIYIFIHKSKENIDEAIV